MEPVIKLDQLSRYLNHLNQLRRINEGDDTADTPGYSMNLMRFPVSVLPGTKTREGYGAEVTITPRVSDKLLESTFQSLVINDLLDTLTLPIVKLVESPSTKAAHEAQSAAASAAAAAAAAQRTADDAAEAAEKSQKIHDEKIGDLEDELKKAQELVRTIEVEIREATALAEATAQEFRNGFADGSDFGQFLTTASLNNFSLAPELETQIRQGLTPDVLVEETPDLPDIQPETPPTPDAEPDQKSKDQLFQQRLEKAKSAMGARKKYQDVLQKEAKYSSELAQASKNRDSILNELEKVKKRRDEARSTAKRLAAEAEALKLEAESRNRAALKDANDAGASVPPLASTDRHARYPVSATQLRDVFGVEELSEVATTTFAHIENHANGQPNYHNIRAFLGEELDKAWKLLVQAERRTHYRPWDTECKGLAHDIRLDKDLTARRMQFRHNLTGHTQLTGIFESLAWAILVDSALLDQQLHDDMKRVAAETAGLPFAESDSFDGLHFCGTHYNYPKNWNNCEFPTPMSAFRDYVSCRWPIHVFAIDPVTQDQNVADSFSSRREIQLTLSVALASGQINAQEYPQYARGLETELDTIALNRTVVGFSHGTDTFGWRFQPRIQTPPTPSNAKVFFNELLIGGPSRDSGMRTSMLEAGTRECVAVVLMPSILNQVDVDFRSSWYRLDKPHSRRFDLEDSVSLGQEVVKLQDRCQKCFKDESKYRKGDLWRLEKAVNQLEKQLPLQNSIVHVPTENTLGGTQLFEAGQTSLGPELHGYYGQPGVHKESDEDGEELSTTLYLVGRNFSVTGTSVVAAGHSLTTEGTTPAVQIISRNVLQVTIPAVHADKIKSSNVSKGGVIDLHVATPYGVSHHLEIPVAEEKAAKKKAETEAAETKKAIETAVTQHVDAAHTGAPKISWKTGKPAETSGKITFGTDGKVKAFKFDNSGKTELALKAHEPTKSTNGFDANPKVSLSGVEVAFQVEALKKDDSSIGSKGAGIVKASDISNYDAIAPSIEKALKGITNLNSLSEIEKLQVDVWVRRAGGKDASKVEDELTIKVQVETEELAIATPVDSSSTN